MQIQVEKLDKIQMSIRGKPNSVATLNDELYMYCSYPFEFINVYDRNNLNELKHVIKTEDTESSCKWEVFPQAICACNLSNCVYVLSKGQTWETHSVIRITKGDGHKFNFSPLINDLSRQNRSISVSANGSLILSRTERPDELISIFNSDGSSQRQIRLSADLFKVLRIIPKSSGNLVLVSLNYEFKSKLTEIDMDANIVHQFQSSFLGCDVEAVDVCDRILIVGRNNRMELLDSELHLLDVTLPEVEGEMEEEENNLWEHPHYVHFDRLRNEVLMIDYTSWFGTDATISSFAFKEGR